MSPQNPGDAVSRFAVSCIEQLLLAPGDRVLDVPCGLGRHARWLAARGLAVVGLDRDEIRVSRAKSLSQDVAPSIGWLVADIEASLPLPAEWFKVVVVVHYVSDGVIDKAWTALEPNGYLVFETFDARGENWRQLPMLHAVPASLRRGFEILRLEERPVGPGSTRAVVRALARRRAIDNPSPHP